MKNDQQDLMDKLKEIEWLIQAGKYRKAKELVKLLREELEGD